MPASRVAGKQNTLRRSATVTGIGVHSGRPASLTIHPAEAGSGICFQRASGHDPVRAHYTNVSATDFCTVVGLNGSSVATIEHLMATLGALDVDNAIDRDRRAGGAGDGRQRRGVPGRARRGRHRGAGCAAPLHRGSAAGLGRIGESHAEFLPYDGMRIEVEIDFANPLIGRQQFAADIDGEVFRREIARARTFGFLADVEQLWARGLALGASLDNAVVIGDDRVINPEGLRFVDECVRHKALDAVGDLALAGAPIRGLYRSYRGGHKLNVAALAALLPTRARGRGAAMPGRASGAKRSPAWVAGNAPSSARKRPDFSPAFRPVRTASAARPEIATNPCDHVVTRRHGGADGFRLEIRRLGSMKLTKGG